MTDPVIRVLPRYETGDRFAGKLLLVTDQEEGASLETEGPLSWWSVSWSSWSEVEGWGTATDEYIRDNTTSARYHPNVNAIVKRVLTDPHGNCPRFRILSRRGPKWGSGK